MLEKWIIFIKGHEKILLVALGGLVLWFVIGRVDTLIANHDHASLQQAQVVAAVQAQKNSETEALVQQQADSIKTLGAQVQAQQAEFAQEKITLLSALSSQKQTDSTMTPTQLTDRWNYLVSGANAAVSNNQVVLSQAGAVSTVQKLEEVPVLTKELDDETQIVGQDQKLLDARQTQIDTLNTLVAGKDASLNDAAQVCKDQIKVVKAEARKSKRRWFTAGVIAGASLRGAVKIFFGI